MYTHIIHRQCETMELLISLLSANFYPMFLLALLLSTEVICNIDRGIDERIFTVTEFSLSTV